MDKINENEGIKEKFSLEILSNEFTNHTVYLTGQARAGVIPFLPRIMKSKG